jgi:OmpA-OmpF porin, OOP family
MNEIVKGMRHKNINIFLRQFIIPASVVLFFIFNYCSDSYAGDSIKSLIKTYKTKAKQYDKDGDIYNAIDYYNRYLRYKNKDVKSNYRLASLYFLTRNYSKARQYYDSVINIKPAKYPFSFYFKGIVSMNLQNYDGAIESLTKFKKVYRKKKNRNEYWKLAGIYIESSEWAKSNQDTNKKITITHLGESINKKNIEFSPFPIDENNLIYGSYLQDTSRQNISARQIFRAEKINGQWKSLGPMDGFINNPGYNTGNAVISDDGLRMYFTRTYKNWKNKLISQIFISNKLNDEWQEPQKLPYPVNDENYTSTQPALGKNLRSGSDILYFVSDRPDGKGGLDIWYSEFDNKTKAFKDPRDLDKGVNSPGNECCPFIDISSSTMYFSSTGRNGLGGYDVYQSVGYKTKWTDALSFPKPINSSFDDYYFSILKNGKEGFFTSNRPGSFSLDNGSCCDDIFYYKFNECTKIKTWGIISNATNYDFYDRINEKYHLGLAYPKEDSILADVPVELYLSGDKEGEEILVSQTKTNSDGRYSFDLDLNRQYKILVKNYGFFDKKLSVSTIGINCSDTIKVGKTQISYLPKITVRINIYYEYDKSRLTQQAQKTIDSMLMPLFDLFPNAIVEIGSHTDSIGSDVYNENLSQRRSESVVNYLNGKGITMDKLVAKGYGASQPIAPNSKPDGSDNPEGRQKNRRTEFKIVGEISSFYKDE